jgi:PhnB protein
MQLTTHLGFDGQCAEAFEFYAKTLKGRIVMRMTYGEMPGHEAPAGVRERIAHIRLEAGEQMLMGADALPGHAGARDGFAVCASITDLSEAQRVFEALAAGGSIQMPFQETFWAHGFGMCADRFGVPWMVNCEKRLGNG